MYYIKKQSTSNNGLSHREIFLGDIYRWIGHMISIDNNRTRRVVSIWVNDDKLSEFN